MKIIIGLLLIGANCIAQNYATNQVYTGCREVDGKAYFPPRSILWEEMTGAVEEISGDGILVKCSVTNEIVHPPKWQLFPGSAIWEKPIFFSYSENKVSTPTRFINNYKAKTAVGATVTVSAMQVGKRKGVELWDCGTPIMKTTVRRVK